MAISSVIIIAIILVKYKPVYKVTISGEEVGYVKSKDEFENKINKEIYNKEEENLAYVTIEEKPEYKLEFVCQTTKTNEDEILLALEEASSPMYTMYAVKLDGEEKTYVKTMEEAEEIIQEIKEEYQKDLDLDLQIEPIYTNSMENVENIEVAKTSLDEEVKESDVVQELVKEETKLASVNGIAIQNKPVTGTITSRFASVSSIRSGSHTGLDIAAKSGTPIKVCSDGTVKFAGWKGSYGNLIIVSHGNGVETWYGHCSKLYAKAGQAVNAGDTIAAVGSTGNSTGPHLHYEIRINNKPVNPQKYIYK